MPQLPSRTLSRCFAWFFAAANALAAVGCSSAGRYIEAAHYPRSAPPTIPANAVIEPGDVVSIRVFGQEPMSTKGRVRPDGTLALPLLGEYPVARKRSSDLARELQLRLAAYVTAPHVSVVIEESPVRITVVGELQRSGRLTLERPVTLIDAIAEAGGVTEFADHSRIFVLRGGDRIRFEYDDIVRGASHARIFLLQHGDVVVVE
jgi:polysaccharide export outer membrane protein